MFDTRHLTMLGVLAALGAALLLAGIGLVACPEAQAATITHDGIMYRTAKVTKPLWVRGGPNYRYQATVIKVKDRKRRHYTIPWSVKRQKRAYVVTQIIGDPFKACKKVQSISVWAPLAYVEDVTFWRADARNVRITVRNCGSYDYLMGASTALIQ